MAVLVFSFLFFLKFLKDYRMKRSLALNLFEITNDEMKKNKNPHSQTRSGNSLPALPPKKEINLY